MLLEKLTVKKDSKKDDFNHKIREYFHHLFFSIVHRDAALLKALFKVKIERPGGLVVINDVTGLSVQSGLLALGSD